MEQSAWATRGWTYQEGLLSKWRLIFTLYQSFFGCNGMHMAESHVLPLDAMHIKSKGHFKAAVSGGAFIFKEPGSKPWDIMCYISQYSRRQLSYHSDTINAMEGIFQQFEKASLPVYHLVGVPILAPVISARRGTVHISTPRSSEECFLIGLSWHLLEPGERRIEFPSWSWAGWIGIVSPTLAFSEESENTCTEVKTWIERSDGSLIRIPAFPCKPFTFTQPEYPAAPCMDSNERLKMDKNNVKFIHIESKMFKLQVVLENGVGMDFHGYKRQGSFQSRIPLGRNSIIYCIFHADACIPLHGQEEGIKDVPFKALTGILLSDFCSGSLDSIVCLGVEEKEGFAERVGCFKLAKWGIKH